MITKFSLYETIRTQKSEMYTKQNGDGIEDITKFINEDESLTDEYKNVMINFINDLPDEFKDKLYASRMILKKDLYDIAAGVKTLERIGLSNVGNDLSIIKKYCEKHKLDWNFSNTYHYVTIEPGQIPKRYNDVTKKYNL